MRGRTELLQILLPGRWVARQRRAQRRECRGLGEDVFRDHEDHGFRASGVRDLHGLGDMFRDAIGVEDLHDRLAELPKTLEKFISWKACRPRLALVT
jgi:hypothetical protein